MAEAAVCLGGFDEACFEPLADDVLAGAVCKAACQIDSDCPPPPPGGDPLVQCRAPSIGGNELRCKLSCAGGRECPDGMFCQEGLNECLWELAGCPYLACDPIEDDCVGDDIGAIACRPINPDGTGAFQCGGAYDGSADGRQECSSNAQCNAGQLCQIDVNDPGCDAPGCCVEECGTETDCFTPGTQCVEYFDPEVVPDSCLGQVGVCLFAEPQDTSGDATSG